ncbi:MAG: tetraacyldisaccharide 4'-kinase [Candidatus Competibacteraceae bacterium]
MHWLEPYWSSLNLVSLTLWPLSLLYGGFMTLRRLAYRRGLLHGQRLEIPVIALGTLTRGDSGITSLIIRLVDVLKTAGYRPGIVSPGAGGQSREWPRRVNPDSDPREVGTQAVLLARRCHCPVAAGPDPAAAARHLLGERTCNLIVAADALQQYALARDIEIAVIAGQRSLGNRSCLPAGPLHEPLARLRSVDFVVDHGSAQQGEYLLTLEAGQAINLVDPLVTCSVAAFRGELVAAVAADTDPAQFFGFLKTQGIRVLEHAFLEHHLFTAAELDSNEDLPVLLPEQDALKCRSLANERCWYIPFQARLDPELERQLLVRLGRLSGKTLNPSLQPE